MFKKLRVTILLYILAFAAVGNYLASARTTDWDTTLWVDVYPINADGSAGTQAYVERLRDEDFDALERYFLAEAKRYGVVLDLPFRLDLAPQIANELPVLPAMPTILDTVLWSLEMRWFSAGVKRAHDRPSPDITLFALYHDETAAQVLDRSTALQRGLIAVANVFAIPAADGSNQVVMAHELLHTLGATDKYAPGNALPAFPHGFADPAAIPLYPQSKAELMAGRIPVEADSARIPANLGETLIGPTTAAEIRWLSLD
ncbi:MAG TPA: hypothetical protein VGC50_00545 [Gammaproteobacteria bacterium]|jgi:hypothetical protein